MYSVTPGFILGPGRINLKAYMNGVVSFSFTMGNAHGHNDLPTITAITTHLERDETSIWFGSGRHSVWGRVDNKLGNRSTTAHLEYLKEHVSRKTTKVVCFLGRCLCSLTECLKHCAVGSWAVQPFLFTSVFQFRPHLYSPLISKTFDFLYECFIIGLLALV